MRSIEDHVTVLPHLFLLYHLFICHSSKKYKYVKRDRVLPKTTLALIPAAAGSTANPPVAGTMSFDNGQPLSGMRFVIIGKTSKKKSELTKMVAERGGTVVAAVDEKVAACISTQGKLMLL